MAGELTIHAFEIIGGPLCVASEDGQKVHDGIAEALRKGHRVNLSFLNVASLTSAFLNAAVGQLYGEFDEEKIRSSLRVTDTSPEDLTLLKRVVETAKEYFKDPARMERGRDEVLEEDDDA